MEFGCGLGYVTRWATSVGADALGIDLSADQIAEATELADGETEFQVGTVYEHGLHPETVDVSYSRWLLIHLNRPVDAMRSIYAALKPGGVMVCEEADMSAMYAEPPSGNHEYVEVAFAVGATLGVDYAGGRGLHRWANEAGFRGRQHRCLSPALPHRRAQGVLDLDFPRGRSKPRRGGRHDGGPLPGDRRGHERGRPRPSDSGRPRAHASVIARKPA